MKHTDPLTSVSYRWRRFKLWLFYGLAACIITVAVVVGVARLLVPYANNLTPHVESWLSDQLNAKVSIEQISVSWPGLTPSILIEGLSVDEGEAERFGIETAAIEFKLLHLFQRHRVSMQVVLVGPKITLTQMPEGDWQFSFSSDQINEQRQTRSDQWHESSQRLPQWLALSIRNADLFLVLETGRTIDLHVAEADVTQQDDQFRLSGWLAAAHNAPEQVQFRLWMARQNQRWVNAQAWISAKELALDYWANEIGLGPLIETKTVLSGQAWAHWDQREGGRLDVRWTLAGEHGVLEGEAGAERWPTEQDNRAWSAELFELYFDESLIAESVALGSDDHGQALAVAYADLHALHEALTPWLANLSGWPASLGGEVNHWMLSIDHDRRIQSADGQITALSVALGEDQVSLEDLDLAFARAGDRLLIGLDGQPRLKWPEVFSDVIELDHIQGDVIVSNDQLTLDAVSLESPFLSARLNGAVYRADERLFLDLLIDAPRIEAIDPRPFLPRTIIPPPAMRWLQQALTFIQSAHGNVLMHFPAGLRTREFQAGHFSSDIEFSGLELAYAKDWPMATEVTGSASFLGAGLSAEVTSGKVNGLTLSAQEVSIARFYDPSLLLRLDAAQVSADRLATTLGQLPYQGWSETFAAMDWEGPVDASVDLILPFKQMKDWSLTGAVELRGNGLSFPKTGLAMTELTGPLVITEGGVSAKDLQAQFGNQTLSFDVTGQWGSEGSLVATTDVALGQWLESKPWGAEWSDALMGETDLTIRVSNAPAPASIAVSIESSLQGLAMALPAPLSKPAEQAWPLTLRWVGGQGEVGEWQLMWPGFGSAAMRSTQQGWAIAVDTGPAGQLPIVPMTPGLEWVGQLDGLDVGGWQRQVDGMMTQAFSDEAMDDWFESVLGNRVFVALTINELQAPSIRPGQASIDLERRSDEWVIAVRGESIQGEIVAPTVAGRPWVVDLEHLYLLTRASTSEETPIQPPNLKDPRLVRPLTLLVESLYWGDLALGSTRMETHRSERGIEIELLDIDGPDLRLQARGRWEQGQDAVAKTAMAGRLSSRNFNQLIKATGYEAGLRAQQAAVDFDLSWLGMPTDFNLIRLEGGLDFELRGGNIPQASAGAGRLLGLVSLSALPRRLILDFRDVFGSGFPYDRITGRFDMVEGQAQTEGVKIASPAAVITLSGSTDMIARSYNQTVVVEPGLGSTLPVIGGLAGGPVGAAAGLVLQSIFNQPLKGVSEVRYTITGPWTDPLIELTDAKVAEASSISPDAVDAKDDQKELTEPPPNP